MVNSGYRVSISLIIKSECKNRKYRKHFLGVTFTFLFSAINFFQKYVQNVNLNDKCTIHYIHLSCLKNVS